MYGTSQELCEKPVRAKRGACVVATFVKVSTLQDLGPGQGQLVTVNNKRIALFNVAGRYYALDDSCPHRGGPLSQGDLEGGEVVCPWHGARFALETGAIKAPPAAVGVASYPVRIQGADIEIEV
jgi:nitrite reductase/ring-hydroxylating ferredoxin subunit